jgi:hypothetical protein
MKTQYCEHEPAVVSALQSGSLPDELLHHVGRCPVCSEVLLVAECLRGESALASEAMPLPDANLVWRKAQARLREKALARATLPIRLMRSGAVAVAILASPWLVLQFSHPPALLLGWVARLSWVRVDLGWLAALTGTTLIGIAGAFVCIGVSSLYMLREE